MRPDGSLNEGLACDGVKAEVAEALGGEDVARGNVARADDVLEGGGEGVPVCVHARGQQRGLAAVYASRQVYQILWPCIINGRLRGNLRTAQFSQLINRTHKSVIAQSS